MVKTSLIIKYNLWYHEEQLNKRYGQFSDWDKCATLDDEDYVAILKFRAEIAEHDRQLEPEKRPGNYDVVIKTHYLQIQKWLLEGQTLTDIGRHLGLNRSVLYNHVNRDHDLKILNKIAKQKREAEETALNKQIHDLLNGGYSHWQIALKLHVTKTKVDYVARKIVKEVSNG